MALRIISFTGTQEGMSSRQKSTLRAVLKGARELHHGDCIGADEEADQIARDMGVDVVIHPPSDSKKRAYCAKPGDVVWEPRPYLERNHDIVDEGTEVIAAPRTDREELRSGTWATVRYGRRLGRKITILHR